MADVQCRCGAINSPSLGDRVCRACGASLAPARTPYGYAPYESWRRQPVRLAAPQALVPIVIAPPFRPRKNVPARFALASGSVALLFSLFCAQAPCEKTVVSFALLGMACSIIGLHISHSEQLRGKGRFGACLGLAFSIFALLASPLPARSGCGPGLRKVNPYEQTTNPGRKSGQKPGVEAPMAPTPRQSEPKSRPDSMDPRRGHGKKAEPVTPRKNQTAPPDKDSEEQDF